MATDTIPAMPPGPPDPPPADAATQAGTAPVKGWLASLVEPVAPAYPPSDTPAADPAALSSGGPGPAASGATSEAFHDVKDAAETDATGEKRKAQGSIWKAWWLAGAQRWAKGGGTANKRLDLQKAKAQAHQVKESRTTVNRSDGIASKGASGAGGKGSSKHGNRSGGSGNSGRNTGGSGNSGRSGSGSHGGSGGAGTPGGGGKGPRGGNGSAGSGSSDSPRQQKTPKSDSGAQGSSGSRGGSGTSGSGGGGKTTEGSGKAGTGKSGSSKGSGSSGAGGGSGKNGAAGKAGKDGAAGKSGGPGSSGSGASTSTDGAKKPKNKGGKGSQQQPGQGAADTRTPLQKSREIGHKDGGAVRNVVDHMRAYKDGAVDGYRDKKAENAKEHDRLDKAHDQHKPDAKPDPKSDTKPENRPDAESATPKPKDSDQKPTTQVTVNGQLITIEDDNAPMEDDFMAKPTPITTKGIDAKKITLGEGFLKDTVSRGELRTFKQYEKRLDGRVDGLIKVADATKALAQQARDQADDCQNLAEQAKGVKGGEKVVAELQKLADQAKAQASEADEVHKRAQRAHDFGRAVLSNIQTRYAPLYQAVVDSDETRPAELKFYRDLGVSPNDTDLAA